jgi:glycosyltransferase involved in cell wall biosynthesis
MKDQICLAPKLSGLGGMVSFQAKFIQGLSIRQIPYTFDLSEPKNSAVLVIGGTRQLLKLWRARQRGVRLYQRLNGMNWMHRVEKTPLRLAFKAEINNLTLAFIRRFLADGIIYQSGFSQNWWDRVYGKASVPTNIIFNGVDLNQYAPMGEGAPPLDHYRILLVEGHLTGGHVRGVETALRLVQSIQPKLDKRVELMVVGEVSQSLTAKINAHQKVWVNWMGIRPQDEIPTIVRSAHLLFSVDINAACPNSVIEALACGLPVLAYDTGGLSELVKDGAGRVVPYGSDHWQLEAPQIEPLADACLDILQNNPTYREKARQRAETALSLDQMVEKYLGAMEVG